MDYECKFNMKNMKLSLEFMGLDVIVVVERARSRFRVVKCGCFMGVDVFMGVDDVNEDGKKMCIFKFCLKFVVKCVKDEVGGGFKSVDVIFRATKMADKV